MKKWLLALSSSSLITTGVSSTVSIVYNNNFNKAEQTWIKLYSEVAAFGMRSGILMDINNIENEWATGVNQTATIKSILPELQVDGLLNSISNDARIDQLYDLVFNEPNFSFKHNRQTEVTKGTNLDIYFHGNDEEREQLHLRAPDTATSQTISTVLGYLQTGFGGGINSQTMATLLSLLNQDSIAGSLGSPAVANIIEQLNQFLGYEQGGDISTAINHVLDSLTEKNVAVNDQTFSQVLEADIQMFFKGLLIFIYQQTIKNDTNVNYNEVFFDKLNGIDDENLVASDNLDMIYAVGYVLKFINSFSRYIAQFDEYRPNRPLGPNNLFDPQKSNTQLISEILNKKYKPGDTNPNDPTWFKVKNADNTISYYTVINPKDFIANLYYYLGVDKENDPNGINLRKLLLMFFSHGDNNTKNPLATLILNNGIGRFLTKTIQNLLQGLDLENNALLKSIARIFDVDGQSAQEIIGNLIQTLILKIANNENLTSYLNLFEAIYKLASGSLDNNLKNVFDQLFGYFKTSQGQAYLAQPFNALYQGNLIPDLLGIISPLLGDDFNVGEYSKLKNIETILQMNIGDLLRIFGTNLNDDITYEFNYRSIDSFLDDFALAYDLTENNPRENGNQTNTKRRPAPFQKVYLDNYLNTQDFENLFSSLTANHSGVFKDNKQIGLVEPLYYTLLGGSRELRQGQNEQTDKIIEVLNGIILKRDGKNDLTILQPVANKTNTYRINKDTLYLLLGLNPDNLNFIKDTVLYNFARLYGNNYNQEEYELNSHLIPRKNPGSRTNFRSMNNAMSSIFNKVLPIIGDISNSSLEHLFQDKYAKYFDNKNFQIKNLETDGFDYHEQNVLGQKIEFDYVYHDPDSDQDYTYHLYLTRGLYGNYYPDFIPDVPGHARPKDLVKSGFMVRKFIRK